MCTSGLGTDGEGALTGCAGGEILGATGPVTRSIYGIIFCGGIFCFV